MRPLLILLILSVFVSVSASGQELGRAGNFNAQGTAYYTYVAPGEVSVQVQVIGDVGNSGIYEVGTSIDLGQLLTLSGGLTGTSQLEGRSVEVSISLLRRNGDARNAIYEASVEDFIAFPGRYPALQDGDIVIVNAEVHKRISFLEIVGVLGSLSSVAWLAIRLVKGY